MYLADRFSAFCLPGAKLDGRNTPHREDLVPSLLGHQSLGLKERNKQTNRKTSYKSSKCFKEASRLQYERISESVSDLGRGVRSSSPKVVLPLNAALDLHLCAASLTA